MDRTSRIGLVVCLTLFVVLQIALDRIYPPVPYKPHPVVKTTPAAAVMNPANAPVMTANPAAAPQTPQPAVAPPVEEKLSTLENDGIKVTLTSAGAGIKRVELKKARADDGGNIILNEDAHSDILALSGWNGTDTLNFQVQESTGSIVYTASLPNGVKWERTYTFDQSQESDAGLTGWLRLLYNQVAVKMGKPVAKPVVYSLDVIDALTNSTSADVVLPAYTISVGRAEPIYDPINKWNKSRLPSSFNLQYLGSGWLTTKFHLTTISDFNPGSVPILGIKTRDGKDMFSSKAIDPAPLHWIGVENQFFTVLLTPATDLPIDHGNFQCFNTRDDNGYIPTKSDSPPPDIEASASFAGLTVPPDKTVTRSYSIYAGPKDFNRLDSLGGNQGELMNYDGVLPFSLLIVPMLTVLHFWFLVFGNYGVAIILLTLMIKAITWPLQSIANRSGKRMQAFAQLPEMKKVREKYKDQPEKLQTAMWAIYADYGVSPVPIGGCLPALIQMPVFFSLYFMLQNAVELRGQSFLWVHDLTKPDAVWTAPFFFLGIHPSLHPLPIMVTALTMVMMRMTPQIGDPQQAKIAQYMPLVFLFIFYNFAAALSLYYVINNCVSIVQIYRNLKKPLPELKKVPKKKKP